MNFDTSIPAKSSQLQSVLDTSNINKLPQPLVKQEWEKMSTNKQKQPNNVTNTKAVVV